MNIFDIIIILFILSGVVVGLKRGFTKQLVHSLGLIVILILSFLFKNPVSIFFYKHFPFFKFTGILKGATALNILLYEVLAFIFVFSVLNIIYHFVILATSFFEKILTMTIILGIPSKILGAVIGGLQSFIWVFIILYLLSFPNFNIEIIEQSNLKDPILKNTPVLSNVTKNSLDMIDEINNVKIKYDDTNNPKKFNREAIDIMLKYNIVKIESIDYLIDNHKIDLSKNDSILKQYRKEG